MTDHEDKATPDYYAILGVKRDATPEEIEQAFQKALNQPIDITYGAALRQKLLGEAFTVLSDPAARVLYDTTGLRSTDTDQGIMRREWYEQRVEIAVERKELEEMKRRAAEDDKKYGRLLKITGIASLLACASIYILYLKEKNDISKQQESITNHDSLPSDTLKQNAIPLDRFSDTFNKPIGKFFWINDKETTEAPINIDSSKAIKPGF